MKFAISGFLFLLSIWHTAGSADTAVTACDLEVAHPSDPLRVGPGKTSAEVVTHRAIPACRDALAGDPENARFHYQLARALVYWADANSGDIGEAMQHLKTAADAGYQQAQFVLGLMYVRTGKVCAAEPYTRLAADQGLKSARLTYVNAVLAGDYDSCTVSASDAEMHDYLTGARAQVSGYYENMLLASLQRQLAQKDR